MTDLGLPRRTLPGFWQRADKVWLLIPLIPLALWLADPAMLHPVLRTAAEAFFSTLPVIVLAVLVIGWLKDAGAEGLVGRAFAGRESRMIVAAALLGGLAPFCSCQVIPFIAALLAAGTPLSAVMAFWLSSPLMDPGMFLVTAGALGPEFALAKLAAAICLGLGGGFVVRAMGGTALFANPLRSNAPGAGCCKARAGLGGTPEWRIWREPARRAGFRAAVVENALFLGKWLMLAYLLEGLMLAYVPAEAVAGLVGGDGVQPVLLGALLGAPAYLNGYAAAPLVAGLLEQGMNPGAAMSFMLAGGVSCIPAALAVWALVRPRVFAAYLGLALLGAVLAGLVWGVLA